jgi:hypothetical protein
MNGEHAIRAALESTRPPVAEPDWDDVLRRARGHSVARRPAALAAVLAAVTLLLAVPAFGIGDRLRELVGGDERPGLTLAATLTRSDGTPVGSFSIRGSRLFLTPRGSVFGQRGKGLTRRVSLPWTLSLASSATEVVVERGGRLLAVLCHPCAVGASRGSLRLTFRQFASLFSGRGVVVLKAPSGTARGVIHLQPPSRKR